MCSSVLPAPGPPKLPLVWYSYPGKRKPCTYHRITYITSIICVNHSWHARVIFLRLGAWQLCLFQRARVGKRVVPLCILLIDVDRQSPASIEPVWDRNQIRIHSECLSHPSIGQFENHLNPPHSLPRFTHWEIHPDIGSIYPYHWFNVYWLAVRREYPVKSQEVGRRSPRGLCVPRTKSLSLGAMAFGIELILRRPVGVGWLTIWQLEFNGWNIFMNITFKWIKKALMLRGGSAELVVD